MAGKIKGTVVLLMKKNVLDSNDFPASVLDPVHESFGRRVSLQLISAVNINADPDGKLGNPAHLDWIPSESAFKVTFDLNNDIGTPGAFLIKNNHQSEFYLKSLTLKDVPVQGRMHFVCNSWVYPADKYKKDRVFFSNKAYLPSETPGPLKNYRKEELVNLRGDGKGELQEWDRVYDYACYNDLGNPDNGDQYARPILGGSDKYPYPRRGRTGRPPTVKDQYSESRLTLLKSLNIYVPRDERFSVFKMSHFYANALKSIAPLLPELESIFGGTPSLEFNSFQDVLKLYEGDSPKYPMPQVIEADKSAWRNDEEFAREMLAGVNPVHIRLLKKFPPSSGLDREEYGNQDSTITEAHIGKIISKLYREEYGNQDSTITEADIAIDKVISNEKLFILDYHDAFMPYLSRINSTSTKTYASRTILFLMKDGTLKPLAIELSLPPELEKGSLAPKSKVYTPSEEVVKSDIWQLAKAYVAVNDSGYHHLISHWLNTHAAIEPFVIATNRQLSVLHPIHKLLHPHFRDTMNINAIARQTLINAGGFLESTVFPAKYSMEMSSLVYKNWVFPEQALPADLIKRGMAVEDSSHPHGLRLLIKDYPFAVDGLEIWSAIETWVKDYSSFYYKCDHMVQNDSELQSWWQELREKGHGDKKDETWWPKMETREELVQTCTIIIWIASALHAAVNFGQYPYAGYLPNRPTISRRLMPEEDTDEYKLLESNPDKVFLNTITARLQTLLGVSLIELLSRHSKDEVYLGKRDTPEWTLDAEPLEAFERFGQKLAEIESSISNRNNDENLKNRVGPVKVLYTLLYPTGEDGIPGKGIPNSVSI